MSAQRDEKIKRITASDILARKGKEPLVCLTAYTTPMAEILDASCDVLLVVVDLPFGSYEGSLETAYVNAVRVLKETGASAVKVESGPTVPTAIDYLVRRGIPVMGHVGLRPQSVLVDGGFKAKGRTAEEREWVLAEARAVQEAGAFSIVVEGVAEPLAREITQSVAVPTIGIGASAGCDGQILVTDDMLGLFDWTPKFVRRYARLREEIGNAVASYAADVRNRSFPGEAETYFNNKPAG